MFQQGWITQTKYGKKTKTKKKKKERERERSNQFLLSSDREKINLLLNNAYLVYKTAKETTVTFIWERGIGSGGDTWDS